MSKIKNGGLDQYGAKPFEQQQFGTAGVERVNIVILRYLFTYLHRRVQTEHINYRCAGRVLAEYLNEYS